MSVLLPEFGMPTMATLSILASGGESTSLLIKVPSSSMVRATSRRYSCSHRSGWASEKNRSYSTYTTVGLAVLTK